jgi:hypothetical protein
MKVLLLLPLKLNKQNKKTKAKAPFFIIYSPSWFAFCSQS